MPPPTPHATTCQLMRYMAATPKKSSVLLLSSSNSRNRSCTHAALADLRPHNEVSKWCGNNGGTELLRMLTASLCCLTHKAVGRNWSWKQCFYEELDRAKCLIVFGRCWLRPATASATELLLTHGSGLDLASLYEQDEGLRPPGANFCSAGQDGGMGRVVGRQGRQWGGRAAVRGSARGLVG